jgi:hypothetical protein
MDLCDSDLFSETWWRHKAGTDFGKHSFASTGRAGQEDIVSPCDGDGQGAFSVFLTDNLV